MNTWPKTKTNTDSRESFAQLLLNTCAVLERLEVHAVPFLDSRLLSFQALSSESQARAHKALSELLDVLNSSSPSKGSVFQNRTLMWRVMKGMGYRPLTDVFDSIKETDILEIYDPNFQIVFASPAFFGLTSYSLEQLYCCPWNELWTRSEDVSAEIESAVKLVISAEHRETLRLSIPVHEVRETVSFEQRHAFIKPKLFAPLIDSEGRCGFISANEFLGPHPVE